jgi:hypothetical protein
MGNGSPRPGDIVVHHPVRSPAVFVVSGVHCSQFSCDAYGKALSTAMHLARTRNLDLWYTTDELRYEEVASYRPKTARRL